MDGTHWRDGRDQVLWRHRELMRPASGEVLGAITVQSLADLGYGVDATQADPYVLPGAAGKASREGSPFQHRPFSVTTERGDLKVPNASWAGA